MYVNMRSKLQSFVLLLDAWKNRGLLLGWGEPVVVGVACARVCRHQ